MVNIANNHQVEREIDDISLKAKGPEAILQSSDCVEERQ